MNEEDPLRSIVGRQLSAVEFVQDYLQLKFGQAGLTANVLPQVLSGCVKRTWGMPGYIDAVIDLIGHIVVGTKVAPHEELKIDFDNGSSIVVSFREDVPYEYASFEDGEHWSVW